MLLTDQREFHNVPCREDRAQFLDLGGVMGRGQSPWLFDMEDLSGASTTGGRDRDELAFLERYTLLRAFLRDEFWMIVILAQR